MSENEFIFKVKKLSRALILMKIINEDILLGPLFYFEGPNIVLIHNRNQLTLSLRNRRSDFNRYCALKIKFKRND